MKFLIENRKPSKFCFRKVYVSSRTCVELLKEHSVTLTIGLSTLNLCSTKVKSNSKDSTGSLQMAEPTKKREAESSEASLFLTCQPYVTSFLGKSDLRNVGRTQKQNSRQVPPHVNMRNSEDMFSP